MGLVWRTGYGAYFADGRSRAYMVVKNHDFGWQALHAEPGACQRHGEWTPIRGSLSADAGAARIRAERFESSDPDY